MLAAHLSNGIWIIIRIWIGIGLGNLCEVVAVELLRLNLVVELRLCRLGLFYLNRHVRSHDLIIVIQCTLNFTFLHHLSPFSNMPAIQAMCFGKIRKCRIALHLRVVI